MLANVGFYVKATNDAIAGGITKRIYKNFYAYLGIGYGAVWYHDESEYWYGDYYYHNNYYGAYGGMAFDGGLIFKPGRHFNFSIGYTHTADFDGLWNCIPNISLGYVF